MVRLYNEDRELQIKLAELEVKMQRKTTEYSTFASLILCSMVVVAFALDTWATTEKNMSCSYTATVVVILFILSFLALNRYYSKQLDKLEGQIRDLLICLYSDHLES